MPFRYRQGIGGLTMNDETRVAKIIAHFAQYTLERTATKTLAKNTLIETGIYTKKGKLRSEFGGSAKSKKAA
jgi:hypothetical protein